MMAYIWRPKVVLAIEKFLVIELACKNNIKKFYLEAFGKGITIIIIISSNIIQQPDDMHISNKRTVAN